MKQEFKDFLSQNMSELDEVGLSKLSSFQTECDNEVIDLQNKITELQSKNDALQQTNIGLNKTNIDLVLRLSGQTMDSDTGETKPDIMSCSELINNFDKVVI